MRVVLLALATVGALAAPATADGGTGITVTTSFMSGSLQIGDSHGMQVPGMHFDLGFRVRRWRLAAELEHGVWSESRDNASPAHTGGFTRLGMALQWAWRDLELPVREGKPSGHFRGFAEVGLGQQRVETDVFDIARNDVMLGVGVSADVKLRKVLFGAVFGVRMLISREPQTAIARGMSSSNRSLDVALLYVFGLRFGH
ncbi:MAG: hypothetical protein ACKV2T_11350 [Kofleriaceae bacterium]